MITEIAATRTPIRELISSSDGPRLTPRQMEMLEFCQAMSWRTWTGLIHGELVCCWGLIPPSLLSNQAYLWLHTTPAMKEHQFLFVRHSQRVVEEMFTYYETIVGHCMVDAEDSIRWLRWLGAVFYEPQDGLVTFAISRRG
jgi:hypothetical protein